MYVGALAGFTLIPDSLCIAFTLAFMLRLTWVLLIHRQALHNVC
jgi:hypothetical protein